MLIGIDASRANLKKRTGTEWYSFHIIREVVARNQHTRFLLYLDAPPLPDLINLGSHVEYRVLDWKFGFLWSQLRLSWEMLRRPPDVLFIPAHTIPLIHPRKTVVTIHDLGFEHYPELYDQKRIGGYGISRFLLHLATRILTFGRYGNTELDYHRWSARYTAHHAAHIITISHFTKQDIITRYHVDAARISVIYLGFDPAAFLHPSDSVMQNTLRQHGITQPYLLSVGRLERKKNIAQLIRVFANIHTQYPQLRLVLVGSPGTGWDEAEDCINQYDLKTHISILGWQPRSVSTALLAGACAFVFLSRFEGFGMPLIEAFAVGTPVIASRTSAIPEIAGDAALLVNPEDLDATTSAILTVVRHPNVQQQLVQRGKNRCALFSWSTAAMETEKVLRSVAQDESSAGVVKKA